MELLLICREAQEDSVIANVGMAIEAKKAGVTAKVLFTEEALAALAGESFGWSPLFQNRDARIRISRNATALGLPVSAERDARWTDLHRLLRHAKGSGVELLACPVWGAILDLDGQLPPELSHVTIQQLLAAIEQPDTKIVGGY